MNRGQGWSRAEVERARRDNEAVRKPRVCPTRTPEVHELGEFSMTCYACHMHADS